jgi:hypothetical protein
MVWCALVESAAKEGRFLILAIKDDGKNKPNKKGAAAPWLATGPADFSWKTFGSTCRTLGRRLPARHLMIFRTDFRTACASVQLPPSGLFS